MGDRSATEAGRAPAPELELMDRYEGARLRFYLDGLEPVDGIVDGFDGHWFHLNDCWTFDGRDVGTVDLLASRVYAIQWAEEDGGMPATIAAEPHPGRS